jgi:hypothetical protein
MRQLLKLKLNHSALWIMATKSVSMLLIILSAMPFLAAPDAHAGNGLDVGWALVGTHQCGGTGTWTNRSPGSALMCDSNGCTCTYYEPVRTVSFRTTGSGFSVTPSGPIAVSGCTGSVDLSCCGTATSVGDNYSPLIATWSPAFQDGSTTNSSNIHIKGIPSMVTAEPFGSSLNFGSVRVGGTTSNQSFQVCNYNSFSVTVNSISINDNNFSVVSGVNTVIPPVISQWEPSCQSITVNFTPQTTGNFNAIIQVNTTAQNPTYSCSGIGTPGPAITTSSSGNGTITPSTTVNLGGSITITMTPSTEYTLNKLTDNGTEVYAHTGTSGTYTYTLNNVTVDHTLNASFKNSYTITASVTGSGGTVSPSTVTTSYGVMGQSFTLTPQTGYTLDKLLDNGQDVSSSTTVNYSNKTFTYYLSFSNITQNHTIQAIYKVGDFPPPPANPVPAISLPVAIFLIAGLSSVLYWRARKTKNGTTSINDSDIA